MANLINTIRSLYEKKEDLEEKKSSLAASVLDTVNRAMDADDKDGDGLDDADPKQAKGKFKDRKDKDIDNDGKVTDSDKYLHKKRKAISKKISTTEKERSWKPAKEGKEKVDVKPKMNEEAIEEQWSITGKDRNGNSHTIYKTKTGGVYSKTGSGSMTSLANYHKDRKLGTNAAQKDLHSKLSGAKDAKSAAASANQHTNMRWVHEEVELDEAKITHADQSSPGKGKRMTDLSKSQHMDAADHHDREQMIAYKKKQGWNEKHHAMMAKAHRMHAQGVGSSHMYKEEVDIYEAVTVKLRGGKVPVGQHKFIYKVDKSPKYIENSIKERDKNAKVEVKGKEVHVTASAGAHSSFIGSLRQFRANGTVTEEIQMDEMNEGTMQRYELIKKAAKKVNKADDKAARDAAKGIKKDKDLKKVKQDPADVAEEVITEGNAAMELKKYANSKGGIDKQDFIAISNMIAKKKSAKDLAMVLKAQDTDPRDKALEIISKNDNKLYHEILKAARGMMPKKTIKKPNLRAQYEEVELEEKVAAYDKNGRVVGLYKDMATAKKLKPNHTYKLVEDYKKDAKDAPFEADPEKKKKQKNSDGTETKPMSRAKQLAKKGLVSEEEMTPAQKRKKEEIVKSMKDKKDYFERKYGDRAKDVMYATATKMAMKEGFELSEETLKEFSVHTYKANQSSKKVATTKNGTNYVDGKAVGPVSDPDGGSASTPTRYSPPTKNGVTPPTQVKKEDKEVEEMVGKNGTVTPSKLAKNDADKQGVGVKYSQGGGKVGLSSTDTAQPFAGATSAKKATVSPVQRLKNLLGK